MPKLEGYFEGIRDSRKVLRDYMLINLTDPSELDTAQLDELAKRISSYDPDIATELLNDQRLKYLTLISAVRRVATERLVLFSQAHQHDLFYTYLQTQGVRGRLLSAGDVIVQVRADGSTSRRKIRGDSMTLEWANLLDKQKSNTYQQGPLKAHMDKYFSFS